MARLKTKLDTKNILLSIEINLMGIYLSTQITTYIWRSLTGH